MSVLRQPRAYAPRHAQEEAGDHAAVALRLLQARVHAGSRSPAQQDLPAAYDPLGAHRLRHVGVKLAALGGFFRWFAQGLAVGRPGLGALAPAAAETCPRAQ